MTEDKLWNIKLKIECFDRYGKRLEGLLTTLKSASDYLKKSHVYLIEGGYKQDGITLDKGVLSTNYELLDGRIEALESVIQAHNDKINNVIIELQGIISSETENSIGNLKNERLKSILKSIEDLYKKS